MRLFTKCQRYDVCNLKLMMLTVFFFCETSTLQLPLSLTGKLSIKIKSTIKPIVRLFLNKIHFQPAQLLYYFCKMKLCLATTFALAFSSTCSAFVHHQTFTARSTTSSLMMAYELVAEPEGGEEIQPLDSMPGSKMKNMGAADPVDGEDGDVCTYWLKAEADGEMIKGFRIQVEKDASKNANFPGFRKGQIPPYAQPQMTMFALQEGIIKTCEAAVSAYGLKALSGSEGSVEVHEDIKDISKGYKVGTNVEFTATFKATIDPEKQVEAEEEEAPAEEVATEE